MSDLPRAVRVTEEGPREGFQIEKGPIATARKIALIDALSQTGLDHIQIVSFVNPKAVPGMADADDVVRGITPRKGVAYTDIDIIEEPARRNEMIQRAGGRTSVPQIFVNGEHIGGADELVALDRAGELDAKLGSTK